MVVGFSQGKKKNLYKMAALNKSNWENINI